MPDICDVKRRMVLVATLFFASVIGLTTTRVAHAQDIRAVRQEIVMTTENRRLVEFSFYGSLGVDATLEITRLDDSGSFVGHFYITRTPRPSTPNVTGTVNIVRGTGVGSRNAVRISFTATQEASSNIPGPAGRIVIRSVYTFEGALRLRSGSNQTLMAGSFTVTTDRTTPVQNAPGPHPFCAKPVVPPSG